MSYTISLYNNIVYDIIQGEHLPALDRDAAGVITALGSEHILKAYADKQSLTATAIKELIKDA